MNIKIGDKVAVCGTDMIGKVIQIGINGLLLINILTPHSAFDRVVYHSNELQKIK